MGGAEAGKETLTISGGKTGTYSNCLKFQQKKPVCCTARQSAVQTWPACHTALDMDAWIAVLLNLLSLPQYSLSAVFAIAFISATLLPLGSEPVVFGLVQLNPGTFWPVVLAATAGNTLGGVVTWWMGFGAHRVAEKYGKSAHHMWALAWLEKMGPKACLLAWLPLVGDPLCAIAGWLKMPFWPCMAYMLVGKFARYVLMTALMTGLMRAW